MNNYREFAYKTLKELIEYGLKMSSSASNNHYYGYAGYMNPMYLRDNDDFRRWSDYSQKIVELSTKEVDPLIHLNYLKLLLSLQSDHTMSSFKKIISCLEFLIKVLEILTNRY
jgi:hypothetical protein